LVQQFLGLWRRWLRHTRLAFEGDITLSLKPEDVTNFIQLLRENLVDLDMVSVLTLPIKKPPGSRSLLEPGDVYRIKGGTEYVDTATSVLVLEKRPRAPMDNVTLYFSKARIANDVVPDMDLDFNRGKCAFEKTNYVEKDENNNLQIHLNTSAKPLRPRGFQSRITEKQIKEEKRKKE
jgi:hypothetical protein